MLQRFLLLWLLLLSALAGFWEMLGLPLAADVFSLSVPYLKWLIVVTMLAIGGLLPRDELQAVLRRWPRVLGGTLVQFGSMPALAWAVCELAGLTGDLRIGVILVGCVPGAMASNVLTLKAGGNVSYSVSLTTTATLFSPVFVPLVLLFTLGGVSSDPLALAQKAFMDLLMFVVVPVTTGHLLVRRWRRHGSTARWADRWGIAGPVVANLAILWIIAAVVGKNRQELASVSASLVGWLLCLNLLGYCAGQAGGKAMGLPLRDRRALTLEVGMQNAGLGAALATQLFPNQQMVTLPAAIYTFGCMLTGTILAQYWSSRASTEPQSLQNTSA